MMQPQQSVPVRVYQSEGRIMVAAALPGMEPVDISVTVSGDALTIRAARRGPHQAARDLSAAEWTTGPFRRDVSLQHPVDSARTNATYGNGVLVLVLAKRSPGTPDAGAEIRMEAVAPARGQWVGHTGHDLHPTTTQAHRQRMSAAPDRARSLRGRG